jgi:hypothetical protein
VRASWWLSKGLFTWSGRADGCADQGIPCVRGPALDMKALHGGTATHATSDAPTIAARRRGGLLPQADVSPADMRATRARLRRRTHRLRQRAALLAHGQQTPSQDHRPAIGKTIASQATRAGVAHRFPELAGHQTIAVDLALLTSDEALLRDLARSRLTTATPHEAHPLDRLPPGPGLGQLLSRVRLDDIHDRDRFPRGQDFVSSGRLVTCANASAGNRVGPSGQNLGTAHLQWACSAAAARWRRHHAPGPQALTRVENRPDHGHALTSRAHQLARAVDDRRTRTTACAMPRGLPTAGRSAGEPGASLDPEGATPAGRVLSGLWAGVVDRDGTPRPCLPAPSPWRGHPRGLLESR